MAEGHKHYANDDEAVVMDEATERRRARATATFILRIGVRDGDVVLFNGARYDAAKLEADAR